MAARGKTYKDAREKVDREREYRRTRRSGS